MTNPITSFTVTVEHQGVFYDATITPLLNGRPVSLTPERLEQLNLAERTHHIFSGHIQKMVNEAVPAYSPEDYGLLTEGSSRGFTFAKTAASHQTDRLWKEFLDRLRNPAPYTQEQASSVVGPDARIQLRLNPYLNLNEIEQREVRFRLFEKKCREYFSRAPQTYTDAEKAYLEQLLGRSRAQSQPDREAHYIWVAQCHADKKEMGELELKLRSEYEAQRAAQA